MTDEEKAKCNLAGMMQAAASVVSAVSALSARGMVTAQHMTMLDEMCDDLRRLSKKFSTGEFAGWLTAQSLEQLKDVSDIAECLLANCTHQRATKRLNG